MLKCSWKYFLVAGFFLVACRSGKLVSDEKKAVKASYSMKGPGHVFFSCIGGSDLDSCVSRFTGSAKNAYEKNIAGKTVYSMDPAASFRLHEEAYKSRPEELFFIEAYAISQHRKGNFAEAARLYEQWLQAFSEKYRTKALLADCYMNLGRIDEAVKSWQLVTATKNRVEIESAIYDVYGRADQYKLRNEYRNAIKKGNLDAFYDLFSLDLNWEHDWWNMGVLDDHYLGSDIALLLDKTGKQGEIYTTVEAYLMIRHPSPSRFMNGLSSFDFKHIHSTSPDVTTQEYNDRMKEVEKEIIDIINSSLAPDDSSAVVVANVDTDQAIHIKSVLATHSLVLNGHPLPKHGKIAADLLEACLTHSVVTKEQLYSSRGQELLDLSASMKDADFLDAYIRLLPNASPLVQEMNKKGWEEFKEERFAWTYLKNSLIARKLNEAELDKAIAQFPNSSRIYLVKTQKAKLDNKDMRPYMIELIKKEFRQLNSGAGLGSSYAATHSSYALKLYFEILQKTRRPKQ